MKKDLNYLFEYLKKEQIKIDKNEFEFQIQSHPHYPSLLSISESLNFFNIENVAFPLLFSDLELLPNRYIALVNKNDNKKQLCFIEKKNNKLYITEDQKTVEISVFDLEIFWDGIVLLVEKSEIETLKHNPSKLHWLLPIVTILAFLFTIINFESTLFSKLFFIFPIIGILFSIATLKDLFGTKSELINNFCNLTSTTSCESIVSSDKWKIFSFINFSDLAIVFFFTQFFGLLSLSINGNATDFFAIHSILIICSLPIIFLSIYFQKFVEKKWCPICLVIISIIVLEILYVLLFFDFNLFFSLKSLILFGFVFSFIALIWSYQKKILMEQKDFKENQLKANRFQRNYKVFKNTLISKTKVNLPVSPLVFGYTESRTTITIITSPFCGFCEEVHEIIERILDKHESEVQIRLIIKANLETLDDESKLFLRNLFQIYLIEGQKSFRTKMNDWYGNKNIQNWLVKNKSIDFDFTKIDDIYNSQNNFCTNNGHNYTPAIFINGFEYPTEYERSNLEYFINELIEDQEF